MASTSALPSTVLSNGVTVNDSGAFQEMFENAPPAILIDIADTVLQSDVVQSGATNDLASILPTTALTNGPGSMDTRVLSFITDILANAPDGLSADAVQAIQTHISDFSQSPTQQPPSAPPSNISNFTFVFLLTPPTTPASITSVLPTVPSQYQHLLPSVVQPTPLPSNSVTHSASNLTIPPPGPLRSTWLASRSRHHSRLPADAPRVPAPSILTRLWSAIAEEGGPQTKRRRTETPSGESKQWPFSSSAIFARRPIRDQQRKTGQRKMCTGSRNLW